MNLDTGRDSQRQQSAAHGLANIPGGSVPAREQQQVHPSLQQLSGGPLGILPGGFPSPYGTQHQRSQTGPTADVLAHLSRTGDPLHRIPGLGKGGQCLANPLRSFRSRTPLSGQTQNFRTVTALEPDPASHPGDGIDYESQGLHRQLRLGLDGTGPLLRWYWRQVTAILSGSSIPARELCGHGVVGSILDQLGIPVSLPGNLPEDGDVLVQIVFGIGTRKVPG